MVAIRPAWPCPGECQLLAGPSEGWAQRTDIGEYQSLVAQSVVHRRAVSPERLLGMQSPLYRESEFVFLTPGSDVSAHITVADTWL